MTFTVVRAVRGAEPVAADLVEKPQRLPKSTAKQTAGSRMDLPRLDDILRLDFVDPEFPETVPGDLA